jgi:glycosyltransferase involved in cell wall biosynthesis
LKLRVGIDASNLRDGGGITHLTELLRHADPSLHGFGSVTVWGGAAALRALPDDRAWLNRVHVPALDGRLPSRLAWQSRRLGPAAEAARCDVLFAPGGAHTRTFRPFVTMFRNMLPFDFGEVRRYAPSYIFFRLLALRVASAGALRSADGVIFLNEYARDVCRRAGVVPRRAAVIPHGIGAQFRIAPRPQKEISAYTASAPFRLLYTSIIDLYKHQWSVTEAVVALQREGIPVSLDLVGRVYRPALKKVQAALAASTGTAVRIRGAIPHDELPAVYREADAFVFASTCENMPNIMIEAMAAGLPIASSNREPMPGILRDAGVYFDPEDPADIAAALRTLIGDAERRRSAAERAFALSSEYSWDRCARETFAFLREIVTGGEER